MVSETNRRVRQNLAIGNVGAGSSADATDPGTFFSMTRRRRKRLDDVDRHLMELIAGDARASQRSLAQRVGVTDETVAARLRRLRDDNVIATTVVIDWEAAGYGAGAIVRAHLSGGVVDGLAGAFRSLPGLHSVTVTTGCCDLLVTLLGTDLAAVRESVVEVEQVKNVVVDAVDVVTTSPVFKTDVHTLPLRPWRSADLPRPIPALDDFDRALIDALAEAAHESNRELARRLSVSDGTVRARIRRLEEGGLIRIVTGRDPVATGEMQAYGMVFLRLDGDPGRELLDHSFVFAAHEVLGRADLVLNVGAPSENDLALFLTDELRSMTGVREIAVAHLVEVIEHRTHLVRLSTGQPQAVGDTAPQ